MATWGLVAPAALMVSVAVFAQETQGPAAEGELGTLKASYEAAVARATQPLRDSYEAELQRIIGIRTQRSDLDGVLAARAELARLSADPREESDADEVATDDELLRQRANFEESMQRLTAPLQATYERELERIVRERTRVSDLDGAIAARAELARVRGNAEEGEDGGMGAGRRPPDEFFVGKTWVSAAGTAFTFREDGICVRQAPGGGSEGPWRRRGALVISYVDGSDRATRYFRFVSATEAYYGNGPRDIEEPVTLR